MSDECQCEKCHQTIRVGDFPFCSPGGHGRSTAAVHQDEIPGGMVVENGFPEPIRVYSHSEHRRLLAERGLEIRAKWSGPSDKHLRRWDIPCATTLANATALLTRTKGTPFASADELAEYPIEVTDIHFARES